VQQRRESSGLRDDRFLRQMFDRRRLRVDIKRGQGRCKDASEAIADVAALRIELESRHLFFARVSCEPGALSDLNYEQSRDEQPAESEEDPEDGKSP